MDSTLISIAVPCGNRLHDLKQTLPYLVETANISPPVEKFWPVPTWPEDRSLWIAP